MASWRCGGSQPLDVGYSYEYYFGDCKRVLNFEFLILFPCAFPLQIISCEFSLDVYFNFRVNAAWPISMRVLNQRSSIEISNPAIY